MMAAKWLRSSGEILDVYLDTGECSVVVGGVQLNADSLEEARKAFFTICDVRDRLFAMREWARKLDDVENRRPECPEDVEP